MNETIITYSDIQLRCLYEYIPGEAPNYDVESPTCGPGSSDDVDIYKIYVIDSNINIYDLFSSTQLDQIASCILEQLS